MATGLRGTSWECQCSAPRRILSGNGSGVRCDERKENEKRPGAVLHKMSGLGPASLVEMAEILVAECVVPKQARLRSRQGNSASFCRLPDEDPQITAMPAKEASAIDGRD